MYFHRHIYDIHKHNHVALIVDLKFYASPMCLLTGRESMHKFSYDAKERKSNPMCKIRGSRGKSVLIMSKKTPEVNSINHRRSWIVAAAEDIGLLQRRGNRTVWILMYIFCG